VQVEIFVGLCPTLEGGRLGEGTTDLHVVSQPCSSSFQLAAFTLIE
jgi:hypothetical protein